MATYTNKFVIKGETKELQTQLLKLGTEYDSVMEGIAESTRTVTKAEKDLATATEKRANEVKTLGKTKAYANNRKEISELQQLIIVEKKRTTALRSQKKFIEEATAAGKNRLANIKAITKSQAAATVATKSSTVATRKKTVAVKAATTASKRMGTSIATNSNELVRHIRRLESYAVALYTIKRAFDATFGAGHEFNKLIEQETIGLKLLISQNLAKVDSEGKAINSAKRYALAQQEANKAIAIARKINLATPHSFAETLQIFKLLTPQVLKLGGSLEEVGTITQRMSVIAASMGIEYQQFLKTVDSALSGEMKESGLKRALEQFGVTNEGIKEIKKRNGDVVEYVINGLEQAKEAGVEIIASWAGATAQFKNEWDDLWGEIQKPLFDALKEDIRDFSKTLKENRGEIVDFVHDIGTTTEHLLKLGLVYAGIKTTALGLRGATLAYNKALAINTALQVANARAVGQSHMIALNTGKVISANTIKLRAMGVALKSFALANPVLLATVGIFTAWEIATWGEAEALEALNKAIENTATEVAKLSDIELEVLSNKLNKGLEDTDEKIAEIKAALNSLKDGEKIGLVYEDGAEALTFSERLSLTYKEQQALLLEKLTAQENIKRSITEQQLAITNISKELKDAIIVQSAMQKKIDNYTNAILKTKAAIANATGKEKEELEKTLKHYETQLAKQREQKLLQDEFVKSLDETGEAAEYAKEKIGGAVEKLKEQTELNEKLHKIYQGIVGSEYDIWLDKINTQMIELAKSTELTADQLMRVYNISAADAPLTIDQEFEQGFEDDMAFLIAQEKSLQDEVEKTTKKRRGSTKALKDDKQELDNIYRKYLELTGQDLKLFELDADAMMKDMMRLYKAGKITAEQLGKAYDGMWEDYIDGSEKARNEMDEKWEDIYEGIGDGISNAFGTILDGDLEEAFANSVQGMVSSLVTLGVQMAIVGIANQANGDPYTAFGRMAAMAAEMATLGVAVALGGGGGGSTSKEDIQEQYGITTEADNESVLNVLESMDWTLTRDLTYSKGIYDNLTNLVKQTGKAAVSLDSNFDLSNKDFTETGGFAGFSSSSTEALFTGLILQANSLSDVFSQFWEVTRTESSSFWGLSSSTSYDYTLENVDDATQRALVEAYSSGASAILGASEALGITNAEQILQTFEGALHLLDFEGKTQEEIAAMISGAIGEDLDKAALMVVPYIQQFQEAGEDYFETMGRIAYELEVVDYAFEQLGGNLGVLGEVGVEVSQAFILASDGMDNALSNMNGFISNFYSDAEKQDLRIKTLQSTGLFGTEQDYRDEVDRLIGLAGSGDVGASTDLAELLRLQDTYREYFDYTLSFEEDRLAMIESAYSGALNYMNSMEKAAYYGDLALSNFASGDISGYFSSLATQLEYEKTISTTREEYAVKFDRYIAQLEDGEQEEKTLTDVVDKQDELIDKFDTLADAITSASFQGVI